MNVPRLHIACVNSSKSNKFGEYEKSIGQKREEGHWVHSTCSPLSDGNYLLLSSSSSSSSFLGECIKLIRSSCVPPFNRMHLIVREFISPAISHNNRWVAAGRCHPTTRLLKMIRIETKIAFRAPLQCRLRNDNRAWHSENCRNETSAMCGDGSRETGATYVDDISINSYFTSICSRIACRTATYDDSKFSNRRRREKWCVRCAYAPLRWLRHFLFRSHTV